MSANNERSTHEDRNITSADLSGLVEHVSLVTPVPKPKRRSTTARVTAKDNRSNFSLKLCKGCLIMQHVNSFFRTEKGITQYWLMCNTCNEVGGISRKLLLKRRRAAGDAMATQLGPEHASLVCRYGAGTALAFVSTGSRTTVIDPFNSGGSTHMNPPTATTPFLKPAAEDVSTLDSFVKVNSLASQRPASEKKVAKVTKMRSTATQVGATPSQALNGAELQVSVKQHYALPEANAGPFDGLVYLDKLFAAAKVKQDLMRCQNIHDFDNFMAKDVNSSARIVFLVDEYARAARMRELYQEWSHRHRHKKVDRMSLYRELAILFERQNVTRGTKFQNRERLYPWQPLAAWWVAYAQLTDDGRVKLKSMFKTAMNVLDLFRTLLRVAEGRMQKCEESLGTLVADVAPAVDAEGLKGRLRIVCKIVMEDCKESGCLRIETLLTAEDLRKAHIVKA